MTTITKPAYPHSQDYVVLTPPGKVLAEKIHEMGIDANELAKRCEIPLETVQRLLIAETAVTKEIAERLEKVTWIPAKNWIRYEENYQKRLEFVKQHPDYPVF